MKKNEQLLYHSLFLLGMKKNILKNVLKQCCLITIHKIKLKFWYQMVSVKMEQERLWKNFLKNIIL